FQAEDGIRDDLVTGVQTCALPIFRVSTHSRKKSKSRGKKCPPTDGKAMHPCGVSGYTSNAVRLPATSQRAAMKRVSSRRWSLLPTEKSAGGIPRRSA